jgi:hypothetical protein
MPVPGPNGDHRQVFGHVRVVRRTIGKVLVALLLLCVVTAGALLVSVA